MRCSVCVAGTTGIDVRARAFQPSRCHEQEELNNSEIRIPLGQMCCVSEDICHNLLCCLKPIPLGRWASEEIPADGASRPHQSSTG
eukprot:scaffold38026_cov245-Skeletonema_marinoi.AAC.2